MVRCTELALTESAMKGVFQWNGAQQTALELACTCVTVASKDAKRHHRL